MGNGGQQYQPPKDTKLWTRGCGKQFISSKLSSGRTETVEVCRFEAWIHIGVEICSFVEKLVIL